MEGFGDLGVSSWNGLLFRLIFWERPVVEGANSDIFFHISGVVINKKNLGQQEGECSI